MMHQAKAERAIPLAGRRVAHAPQGCPYGLLQRFAHRLKIPSHASISAAPRRSRPLARAPLARRASGRNHGPSGQPGPSTVRRGGTPVSPGQMHPIWTSGAAAAPPPQAGRGDAQQIRVSDVLFVEILVQ